MDQYRAAHAGHLGKAAHEERRVHGLYPVQIAGKCLKSRDSRIPHGLQFFHIIRGNASFQAKIHACPFAEIINLLKQGTNGIHGRKRPVMVHDGSDASYRSRHGACLKFFTVRISRIHHVGVAVHTSGHYMTSFYIDYLFCLTAAARRQQSRYFPI